MILFDRARFGPFWHWPLATGELIWLIRQLRAGRFDWAIDLQGLFRSGFLAAASGAGLRAGFADAREFAAVFYNRPIACQSVHTVDRNVELARQLGIDARGDDMTLQVSPQGEAFARELLARHGLAPKGFLVVFPCTRWPTKQYPPRHWRAVIAGLTRQVPVVVMGGRGAERQLCDSAIEGLSGPINLSGQTDIPQMVAMIAAAAGVICCDSAAMFIAPAVDTNVLTLMGPTRPERTGPYRRGRAIVAHVPCQGCLKRRCSHVTCMQTIDPQEVIRGALDMLRGAMQPCI